ncbi:MAG TPA: hypothetical protein VNB93_02830 [Rubrobacter sp.]|nr:hypothetical protein [Rubrobacter sp.]
MNESDMTDKPAKYPRYKTDPATLSEAEEGMREELENTDDTDDWVARLITGAEEVTGCP